MPQLTKDIDTYLSILLKIITIYLLLNVCFIICGIGYNKITNMATQKLDFVYSEQTKLVKVELDSNYEQSTDDIKQNEYGQSIIDVSEGKITSDVAFDNIFKEVFNND